MSDIERIRMRIASLESELQQIKADLKQEPTPKVIDLSVVAGSDIPMLFWNHNPSENKSAHKVLGMLQSVYSTLGMVRYVQQSLERGSFYFYRRCAFDTTKWVHWRGSECPLPEGVEAEVEFRDRETATGSTHSFNWVHSILPSPSDIIGYRVTDKLPGWVYAWELE